jgi:hypothetical protein
MSRQQVSGQGHSTIAPWAAGRRLKSRRFPLEGRRAAKSACADWDPSRSVNDPDIQGRRRSRRRIRRPEEADRSLASGHGRCLDLVQSQLVV